MSKKKVITVCDYLKNLKINELNANLRNFMISNIDIDEFLMQFGDQLKDNSPEAVVEFILNPNNQANITMFGYRYNRELDNHRVYNGMSHDLDGNANSNDSKRSGLR